METQSIEEFYQSKFNWMPANLKKEIGHFNVFKLDPFVVPGAKPIAFIRRAYFKITLLVGKSRIHYADKTVDIEKQGLMFSNPFIPYNWEKLEEKQTGFFCVFTEEFFNQFGVIREYPVFKPGGSPVFSLTDEQRDSIIELFQKMMTEIGSDYVYKYDLLRTLVFELMHSAMKMQPADISFYGNSNAASRIASLFAELLERQFPIELSSQQLRLRTPLDFASQLSVHVNHLNRALKEVTGKTTTQLIGERVTSEARLLLKHTNWNISEIAWSLGFEELSHFTTFFKKHTQVTPRTFRETETV